MKIYRWGSIGVVMLLSVACAIPVAAQGSAQAILTLPVSGSFQGGGDFEGSISISSFEAGPQGIVAVGFVAGVLSRANRGIGTAVKGELEWPVVVRSGGVVLARGRESQPLKPSLIAFSPAAFAPTYLPAQAPSCPVLDVSLGPINVDLLGFQVALGAVNLNIGGQEGTPVGDLVCAASKLVGGVAGVVELLASLLNLLTGLLGGLTGGLAGGVPA